MWKFSEKSQVIDKSGIVYEVKKQAVIGEGSPIYFCESEQESKWIREQELKQVEEKE